MSCLSGDYIFHWVRRKIVALAFNLQRNGVAFIFLINIYIFSWISLLMGQSIWSRVPCPEPPHYQSSMGSVVSATNGPLKMMHFTTSIRENNKYLLLTSVFDQLPRSIFARDKLCFRACAVISPPDRRVCPRIL